MVTTPPRMQIGSSPLARGKHRYRLSRGGFYRLIPARAGKTYPKTAKYVRCGAHPRSRGENPAFVMMCAIVGGSSPLARGKHWCHRDC